MAILGLLAALVAIAIVACGGSTTREVQGVLIDVQNRDLVNAEHISLRDAAGVIHHFLVSPEVARDPEHPTTASHLKQHMARAEPVIVRYRETPEGRVAFQVQDKSAPQR